MKYQAELEQYFKESAEYSGFDKEGIDSLCTSSASFADKILDTYEDVVSESFCPECEQQKFFDTSNSEYYCPIHDR